MRQGLQWIAAFVIVWTVFGLGAWGIVALNKAHPEWNEDPWADGCHAAHGKILQGFKGNKTLCVLPDGRIWGWRG